MVVASPAFIAIVFQFPQQSNPDFAWYLVNLKCMSLVLDKKIWLLHQNMHILINYLILQRCSFTAFDLLEFELSLELVSFMS